MIEVILLVPAFLVPCIVGYLVIPKKGSVLGNLTKSNTKIIKTTSTRTTSKVRMRLRSIKVSRNIS